jgi:hypothetical protein
MPVVVPDLYYGYRALIAPLGNDYSLKDRLIRYLVKEALVLYPTSFIRLQQLRSANQMIMIK